jgi:hypothetical protein
MKVKSRLLKTYLEEPNFYLRVPLGCVKLHHSREALEYNKPTQKFVVQLMIQVVKEIQGNLPKKNWQIQKICLKQKRIMHEL